MAGKGTDRKQKGKDGKSTSNEQADALATFTLPDSLPCSEIDFPAAVRRPVGANWKQILKESDESFQEIEEYRLSKQKPVSKSCFLKTECDYIKNEVFVQLLPALEETLNKAKLWEALIRQKCFFNGLDHIAQVLWNNNPRYPGRKEMNMHLFNMPWVRKHLQNNPRPHYPKSWLWPEEYAATLIQKTVRQYFVQREEEVQEMRDFWKMSFKVTWDYRTSISFRIKHQQTIIKIFTPSKKKLEMEKSLPEMEMNPFLAKKFASSQSVSKANK